MEENCEPVYSGHVGRAQPLQRGVSSGPRRAAAVEAGGGRIPLPGLPDRKCCSQGLLPARHCPPFKQRLVATPGLRNPLTPPPARAGRKAAFRRHRSFHGGALQAAERWASLGRYSRILNITGGGGKSRRAAAGLWGLSRVYKASRSEAPSSVVARSG